MEEEKNQTPYEFKIPVLDELQAGINELQKELKELKAWLHPKQEWYSLKEISAMKGVPYGSLTSRPYLKPNRGKPDGFIAGKARWKHSTVMEWIKLTDEDMERKKKTA